MHTSLALTQNLTECEHFSSQLYYMAALSGTKHNIPLCRYVINLENVNHFMKHAIKCIPKNHDEVHKTEPWSLHDEQRLQYSGRKKSDIWKYICALWTSMNLLFSTSWEIDRNIYIHLSHQCFFWGADHSFAWLDTVIYGYPQCKHSPSSHDYGEIVKMLWL